MSFNDDFRLLADQINKLAAQLPQEAVKMLPGAAASAPTQAGLMSAIGDALGLDQQMWLSRPENLARLEPFLRSAQGKALIAACVDQLRAYARQ